MENQKNIYAVQFLFIHVAFGEYFYMFLVNLPGMFDGQFFYSRMYFPAYLDLGAIGSFDVY